MITFVLSAFTFTSCDSTDYVNDLGSIISPVDQVKYQKIIHSSIADCTITVPSDRGSSKRLLAGGFEDYETLSVLKFNDFSALSDTVSMSKILLELTLSNTIGDSTIGTLDLFLFKNDVDWQEDNLKLMALDDFTPFLESIRRFRRPFIDRTTVAWGSLDSASKKITFNIPLDIVESWKDSSETNADTNGVVLIASPFGFIASFHSRSSSAANSLLPALVVTHIVGEDTSTTTRIVASADGYLLNILSELPDSEPDKIFIGGGAAYRSMVMIDSSMIDSIPVNVSIVDANLTLTIDRQNSLLPESNSAVKGIGISLLYNFVEATGGTDSLLVIDETDFNPVALPIDGDKMALDLTRLMQQWVTGDRESFGIALWSNSESSQIFRIAFYGQNSSVSDSLKPNIDIYYVNSPENSN